MHSWHRHVHPGNYGRADPDYSVLALWNGMSDHRLTEGGTECLGGISRTGSMCGPCRQLALGPSAQGHVPATANHTPSYGQMAKRENSSLGRS